jgi:hypothetical protein
MVNINLSIPQKFKLNQDGIEACSMKSKFLQSLTQMMATYGFSEVVEASKAIPNVELLLKRQTWNTNRAIVVVTPPEVRSDFARYFRKLRRRVAFKCGFFPFFWGIGIQVILVVPGLAQSCLDPNKLISRIDNQWAIVQSVFLVDPTVHGYRSASTWGQLVTGKFQDAIADVLGQYFQTPSL